jgi:hypothetical protein
MCVVPDSVHLMYDRRYCAQLHDTTLTRIASRTLPMQCFWIFLARGMLSQMLIDHSRAMETFVASRHASNKYKRHVLPYEPVAFKVCNTVNPSIAAATST